VTPRTWLVRLVSQGAPQAEIVRFLREELDLSQYEAYMLLDDSGVEFGRIGALLFRPVPKDDISDERRRYLQQLSLSDE